MVDGIITKRGIGNYTGGFSTSMRKVVFVNRLTAERLIPTPKTAIISVNSDNDLAVLSDNWVYKLYLIFHDLDKPLEGYDLFNEGQAKEVIDFVADVAEKISVLVVHCDAGVSRSAAIAKFVAEKYGLYFEERYSLYNKHVYSLLRYVDSGIIIEPTEPEIGKYGSRIRFI